MPQQIPTRPRPNDERGPAVRADAHLRRGPTLARLPTLTASQQRLLEALVVPDRVGPLPEYADRLDPKPLISAAVGAGLVSVLRSNATHVGLSRLVDASAHEAQRQTFVARERHLTARRAARTIARLTGEHPLALGALAATSSVYGPGTSRLRDRLVLTVAPRSVGTARRATADLRGVEIRARALPGRGRQASNDAIWLRSSRATPDGWRVPAAEDQLLLGSLDLARARGSGRLGILVDLLLLSTLPSLHWSTMAQRAGLWRVRPAAWDALREVTGTFGARIPKRPAERLRPRLVERVRHALLG
ncbi:MAG: hypothetical protein ACQEXJ_23365 [Myxococcota bacterium]